MDSNMRLSLPGVPPLGLPHFDLPVPVLDAAEHNSPLTQWWIAVVGLFLVLGITVWVIRRRKYQSRLQKHFGWAVAGVSMGWVLVVLLAVNSWFSIFPDFSSLQRQTQAILGGEVQYRTTDGGRVAERKVPATPSLSMPQSSAWVYTPPGYDQAGTTRYPVIYLIHGYPGTSADWFTLGQADNVLDSMIATKVIPPLIAVAPDVNGGDIRDGRCLNSLNGGPQIESWLYQKLIPWTDETLLTQADWQHRILGGMSSGGYCALDQGLRYQGVWGGIVALESYGDPGQTAAKEMGYDRIEMAKVSPTHYIPTMKFDRDIPIFLDVGELAEPHQVELLAQALKQRGQPVTFRVESGQGHTWATARLGLAYGLAQVAPVLGWK